ncbi:putative disease resistance protein RGA3 [Magnolia sinica]|uniref:putative disease resistance protein RGA3 n=1 Tax=Magnolia sinica TaxID=86752 RepID=UPI00265B272D|nr:putative disease resistance protein RGA3 [Magnolia sinica]
MADALVLSVVRSLNTIIQPELGLVFSARQELQKLSSAFTAIQAVLRDADRRQVKEEALSNWLEKLKDIGYDVDDLLDEWRAEALRLEIDGTGIPTCGKKVCNFFLRRFCFNEHVDEIVFHLKLGVEMGRKVKTIRERLDMICDEHTKFRLDERWEKTEIEERRTSSLIDESEIIGRNRDKERIINWLLTETGYGYEELPVGSIVGMGGLGKTTLAQLVYRDERVIRNFERRMWVHVSQVFDEMRLCKAIIEAVEGTAPPNFLELEMVHIHLRKLIEGRRFLLVLDDMWNESQDKWDKLRLPLIGGASGSRILITTQNETVMKVTGRAFTHLLKPLQEDDCWLFFSRIAFLGRSTREQLELEGVGRQIANKCGGVPLVVKRIGNAMRFRRTVREWKLVLESQTWDLPIVARGIVFELQVSYYNMPSHLKQCFAFCSIFPRDHVIEKEMLIKLWMAHGFILCEESGELESVGEGYFDDLLRRSLFEDPMTDDQGNVMHCKMKEIIHDLFRIVKSECHIKHRETSSDVPMHARHFSLVCTEDLASIPGNLYKAKNLRTLLFIGWSRITGVPSNIFESLRCLRVLDLSGTNIKRLPNSLGDMKLLRIPQFVHHTNRGITRID